MVPVTSSDGLSHSPLPFWAHPQQRTFIAFRGDRPAGFSPVFDQKHVGFVSVGGGDQGGEQGGGLFGGRFGRDEGQAKGDAVDVGVFCERIVSTSTSTHLPQIWGGRGP
jgi:hypothetical protein